MSAQPPYRPPTSPPPGYPRRDNRPLLIAAAVVALIAIGALGYWLGGRNSGSTSGSGTPSASAPAASGAASAPASGTPSAPASAAPSGAPSGAATGAPSATPSSAPPSSAAPKTTTTSPSPTVTPFTHPDPDFGYVKTVTTSGGVTKLTFDRATLLTGPAAASAAKAHGQAVEDDYFIVNDNKLIRTFTISPSVVVVGSQNLTGGVGPTPSTLAALTTYVSAHKSDPLPVDLAYDAKGTVVKITEVFFP